MVSIKYRQTPGCIPVTELTHDQKRTIHRIFNDIGHFGPQVYVGMSNAGHYAVFKIIQYRPPEELMSEVMDMFKQEVRWTNVKGEDLRLGLSVLPGDDDR